MKAENKSFADVITAYLRQLGSQVLSMMLSFAASQAQSALMGLPYGLGYILGPLVSLIIQQAPTLMMSTYSGLVL